MFIDKTNISIKGGDGGNGCVSFYRAKYVTNGGPDGGDGGRGGDVIFVAEPGLSTLLDFRYRRRFSAGNGADGGKRNCTGADGEDIIIKVPQGTLVREAASGKVMADMSAPGAPRVLIKGGRGGRGNQHFATPTRQAPRYAERGKPAREYDVTLELKLIADVGIIGLPNVGKSTLLAMATNANPKIADYHFTTLSPNLGVVRSRRGADFVLADIPGLIEGASGGAGLGHDFLRHTERTRAFIHVVDAAAIEGGSPMEDIMKIDAELAAYNPALALRPQVIAANKMDLPGAEENYRRLKERYEPAGRAVFPISAAANAGIDALLAHTEGLLRLNPRAVTFEEDFEEVADADADREPFTIEKTAEKGGPRFIIEGAGIERMLGRTNLDTEKGFAFFQRYLREKGINARLEELNIQEGDSVRLCGYEFEYYK